MFRSLLDIIMFLLDLIDAFYHIIFADMHLLMHVFPDLYLMLFV